MSDSKSTKIVIVYESGNLEFSGEVAEEAEQALFDAESRGAESCMFIANPHPDSFTGERTYHINIARYLYWYKDGV